MNSNRKNIFKNKNFNWIKIITGPMFSGKTTQLILEVQKLQFSGLKAIYFKPSIDNRLGNQKIIKSRNGNETPAVIVDNSNQIKEYLHNLKQEIDVIAVDEIQFFDSGIIELFQELANKNYLIIACGLNLQFNGKPFNIIPNLLSIADEIITLNAYCSICSGPATKTYRKNSKITDTNILLIGDTNEYEPRCNIHFHYE